MGYFRLFLAFCVVVQHISGTPYIGASAVQVFFVLSGFLMTSVMHKTYGYSRRGVGYFWLNRALRLFPTYFVVMALTIFILMLVGEEFSRSLNHALYLPHSLMSWFQNVTMLFVDNASIRVTPRLSPPTWALTLELFSYFLISLGVSKSFKRSWIWLIVGCLFLAWAIFLTNAPRVWGYGTIPSAFAPFAIGAIIFHMRETALSQKSKAPDLASNKWQAMLLGQSNMSLLTMCLASIALILLAVFRARMDQYGVSEQGSMLIYLLNLVPATIAVNAAINLRFVSPRIKKLNSLAGNLSYPVYLSHWMVAVLVSWLSVDQTGGLDRGFGLLTITSILLLIVSQILVVSVDKPVNFVRDKVRQRASQRSTLNQNTERL